MFIFGVIITSKYFLAQIPIGVLLKNEDVIDDMVHILDALYKL